VRLDEAATVADISATVDSFGHYSKAVLGRLFFFSAEELALSMLINLWGTKIQFSCVDASCDSFCYLLSTQEVST
jgi:hypothetical protein